jgi:hypothetical protein
MTEAVKSPTSNPFQFSLAWLLAYITAMALVCGGMVYGRWAAFQTYGTEQERVNWIVWKFHVAARSGDEPVLRKVPKSAEPPALVLMRDHFVVCLVGSLLLSSVLFGTFMIFLRGALASHSRSPMPDPRSPAP